MIELKKIGISKNLLDETNRLSIIKFQNKNINDAITNKCNIF